MGTGAFHAKGADHEKRILSVLLVLVMLLLVLLYSLPVEAAESSDLKLMRVTCYTYPPSSITASGSEVREGIVAAKGDGWMLWLSCMTLT